MDLNFGLTSVGTHGWHEWLLADLGQKAVRSLTRLCSDTFKMW